MIFSNKQKNLKEIEINNNIKYDAIILGESGRGRKRYALPSHCGLEKGINKNISLGTTKSGKPRIIREDDGMYLIVDTQKNYTRKGNGWIVKVVGDVQRQVIASGADGAAGRIGSWDVEIVKVLSKKAILQVVYGGFGYDADSYRSWIFVNDGEVDEIFNSAIDSFLEQTDLADQFLENWQYSQSGYWVKK